MRFLAGLNGSTEKRVGLQLCLLASTLACQGFGSRIHLARFLEMRAAPSKVGWIPSLLIRPGPPQNVNQLSTKNTSFSGHHLDSQRLSDDMQLNISSLVKSGRSPGITEHLKHWARESRRGTHSWLYGLTGHSASVIALAQLLCH